MHANRQEVDRRGLHAATSWPWSASATRGPATRSATRTTRSIWRPSSSRRPSCPSASRPRRRATTRSWARRCTSWRTRIRPSWSRFDDETQRDDHLRHGRAAPGDHRGPPEARVQRGRARSAGPRWPTARPRTVAVEGAVQARQADRRPRPVRPRVPAAGAAGARAAASSSSTRSWAGASRRSTSRPWRRASSRPCSAARSPAIPVVDMRVTLLRRLVPRGGLQRLRLPGSGARRLQAAVPARPSPSCSSR